MRRERLKKKKQSSKKIFLLILIVLLGILGLIYLKGNSRSFSKIASTESLQIGTFIPGVTTPSPTAQTQKSPGPPSDKLCSHDTGVAITNSGEKVDENTCNCLAFLIECKEDKCVRFISYRGQVDDRFDCSEGANLSSYKDLMDMYCGISALSPTDGVYCVGKPVIYLYPKKPTIVNVEIKTPGEVVVSDPPYPVGGWKNILAEPGGKLTYQGMNYKELFYETNVKDVKKPLEGLTLKSDNINKSLDELISRLGLRGEEKTEFLDYWIPRLKALNTKYIFFGLIEPQEKDRIDKVVIDPKPDTFIEFIAYFAPLNEVYNGPQLTLPETPERVGFTAVEWGGTIGNN